MEDGQFGHHGYRVVLLVVVVVRNNDIVHVSLVTHNVRVTLINREHAQAFLNAQVRRYSMGILIMLNNCYVIYENNLFCVWNFCTKVKLF